jgi:carbon storage regulator CsrA
MLVFTRKTGEAVVVTGLPGRACELKVSVIEIRGGRVRLGFEADRNIVIDRSEITDRKRTFVVPLGPDEFANAPVAAAG